MDQPFFFKVMTQLAEGMAYLHSLGLMHRDLKPANLLIDACRNLKICDFGMSVDVDQVNQLSDVQRTNQRTYLSYWLVRSLCTPSAQSSS